MLMCWYKPLLKEIQGPDDEKFPQNNAFHLYYLYLIAWDFYKKINGDLHVG